jgi:pimeloyl-ACP methyl ester carboxylesterase
MRSGPSDARRRGETHPPVLFLTGVGLTAGVARRAIAELEKHFCVIGAGTSTAGAAPATAAGRTTVRAASATAAGRTTAGVAAVTPFTLEDALAALDAAGAERAHVVGLSFGGAIAQEIAVRHPERVRSLVLGSSTAGGELYVVPQPEVRAFLGRLDELPSEEGLWASVPYLYATETWRGRAPLIGEDIAARLRRPLDPRNYRRQHAAARAHNLAARLAEITAPTLVVHGQQDRILPLGNGRRLAGGITGARFVALKGAGHAFPTDVPGATSELVSFLLAHSRRQASRAPSPRTERATRA